MSDPARPVALSVVIPTIRTAESLEPTLSSLERQSLPAGNFEVIVVLDGPDDGRAARLDRDARPYRLTALASPGRGRAAACDAGIAAASGDILLLLDDDMTPDPGALEAHLARHRSTARIGVMGAVPVTLGPGAGLVTRFIARRFRRHLAKLARPGYRIDVRDVYTGAFSIERGVMEAVGGFDQRFVDYGNEDGELAGRLMAVGVEFEFAPEAIAHQAYAKSFAALAADSTAKGRTAVQFVRAHPERAAESALDRRSRGSRRRRFVRGLIARGLRDTGRAATLGSVVERSARAVERLRPSLADRMVEVFLDGCFWAGVREAAASAPKSRARTVVHYVEGSEMGGAQRIAADLARGLDATSWRTAVIVQGGTAAGTLSRELQASGIDVKYVSIPVGLGSILAVRRLAHAFRGLHPAVVHIHRSWAPSGNAAVVAARIAGARVVATEHLYLPSTPRRAVWLRRVVDRLVDRTIAVSDDLGQTLLRRFHADPPRLRVVRNGVAAPGAVDARTTRATRRAILGDGPSDSIVLVPARLQPQKDHATLLSALAQLPGVVAALAGDGPERDRLAQLAADLGVADRVRFLGDRRDMAALMTAADIVVLPSRAEGLPLVILEAFALGRPVVATAVGGTPEVVIDGETGRSVPAGDVAALAAAIRGLLADPKARQRLGRQGKARYRAAFTSQRMVRETSAVYDELFPQVAAAIPAIANERQTDWRYLGLRSRFRVVASFGWPAVELAGVATEIIDGPSSGTAVADLVVASEPDAGAVARMRAVLARDGVAIVRTHRPRRMARRLAATGFGSTRIHAPWPSAALPRAFVPLDDDVAAGRMLGRMRHGLRGRLGAARRSMWLRWQRWGLAGSAYVVGATDGGASPAIARAWTAAFDETIPSRLSWTILTGGRESISKVVGIATPGSARAPGLVVKWPRTTAAATALSQEAAMLADLGTHARAVGVPRLVDTWPDVHGAAIVETLLPGVPMGRMLSPQRHERLGELIVDWLSDLGSNDRPEGGATAPAVAGALIDRLERQMGSAASSQIAAQRAMVRRLEGVPLVIEHRDLAPWNILVDDASIGVVDWESSVSTGLPLLDLWYFLTYSALAAERIPEGKLAEAYPRLHDPRTRTGGVTDALVDRYIERMGLDPAVVPILRALTWVAHLPSELDRRPADADRMAGPFVRLWTYELARCATPSSTA